MGKHFGKKWKGKNILLNLPRYKKDRKKYPPFEKAKKILKKFKLKNVPDYVVLQRKIKKKIYLPAAPQKKYKKSWKGWGDYLGTGNIPTYKIIGRRRKYGWK